MERIDYELIEGKPFFGLEFGKHVIVCGAFTEDESDPVLMESKKLLKISAFSTIENKKDLEIRHMEYIIRRPSKDDILNILATIGLRYVIWGRAFRVMKLTQGKRRSKKKIWLNGRRVKK